MKKIVLLAVAGMLTTATIVYATVSTEKKVKKEITVKKELKCKRHCIF